MDEDEEPDDKEDPEELAKLRYSLAERCKAAGLAWEPIAGFDDEERFASKLAIPAGRDKRWVYCWSKNDYQKLLAIEFENYTYLAGLDAICCYSLNEIEALVRPIPTTGTPRAMYRRVFGVEMNELEDSWGTLGVHLASSTNEEQATLVSLSAATPELAAFVPTHTSLPLSLKIRSDQITQHDQALECLRRHADALFFQIDLATDVSLTLIRERVRTARRRKQIAPSADLNIEYPRHEYDSAPMSLYWYGRSAVGMPLLQFLAYYQVIEFYYPTYSQAEARRTLKAILKNPTFRGDRDADLGRALSAIQLNRSGAFGDERSQLKATLAECVNADALRAFLTMDSDRSAFLASKTKGLSNHKIPIATVDLDLRNDVAERLYEIRCKIVHTKADARSGELELLLPYSKEAEQLHFDIEVAGYLAQQVLVSASTAFH